MTITRRDFTTITAMGAAAALTRAVPAFADAHMPAEGVTRSHGATLMGELKYPADFPHYDYVNPNAPKGGLAVARELVSSFDSFNPFVVRGSAPFRLGSHCIDALMTAAGDQGSTQYGLLAEWYEYPEDFSWARYKLREAAKWSDGTPLTGEDIAFSLAQLKEAHIFYAQYYKNVVETVVLEDHLVEFRFDIAGNRELPQIIGQLPALPKHYWAEREFDATLDKPVVSGPYEVGDFEAGRFVEFIRRPDYWGADLPVNIGKHNFDRLRYEVFGDGDAALQAFQSGDLYYREENSSKNWATRYDFPAVESGEVVKLQPEFEGPQTVQGFAFNLRRPKFAHRLTRRAIAQAFDFQWANDRVFFNQYAQPYSYFQNTPSLMASGLPEGRELEILEPYRDQLPEEVFTEVYEPPQSDGSGRDRAALRQARQWLLDAGWKAEGGRIVDENGRPFEIEFIMASGSGQERVLAPFKESLARIGVEMTLRTVDRTNYVHRLETYDYDMCIDAVANSESPGNEQREYWGTEAADQEGGRNAVGLKDSVVDALIEDLIVAESREELEYYSKALDRVLLWGFYHVMELYTPFDRLAYWKDKVTPPTPLPPRNALFPHVWWATEMEG